jgi:hypothetical protein
MWHDYHLMLFATFNRDQMSAPFQLKNHAGLRSLADNARELAVYYLSIFLQAWPILEP